VASWLESFRDRVVQRSQVGKKRLEVSFARRDLDRKFQEVGERFVSLARQGTATVPQDLAALVQEVRELEDRLRTEVQEIAALESES
jgi:hypothetical protein